MRVVAKERVDDAPRLGRRHHADDLQLVVRRVLTKDHEHVVVAVGATGQLADGKVLVAGVWKAAQRAEAGGVSRAARCVLPTRPTSFGRTSWPSW